MYLQIKKANLVPDKRWHRIEITMVWLYDNDWKYIRRVKLTDEVIQDLLVTKIQPWMFNTHQHTDD